MFAKILAFLLIATPLFATDFDTLWYGNIDDALIVWDSSSVSGFLNRSYWAYSGATESDILEKSDIKKRMIMRFSASGLAQVPDTNAVSRAILYVKTGLFSVPYQLNVYALSNDRNWTEGSMTGVNAYSYGHKGASWVSPAQPPYPDTITGTLPSYFDWRDSNITTTIKSQGFCGSCWAHATVAQVEAAHKKDVINYTIIENAEDGTGSDRNISPLLTPSPEVTATGWESRSIPAWLFERWYRTSGTDNGLIFIPEYGDIRINTANNASNKPRFFVKCATIDKTTGLYTDEVTIQITGTSILDSYINSGAATTNYNSSDSARINSTERYIMRIDSTRKVINDALAGANDTVVSFTSISCSLYVGAKYSDASVGAYKILKSKFIADSVTWNQYRDGKEWGTAGANLSDQLDLSEQQLVSCVTGTDCANGGSITNPFFYFRDNDSIMTEEAFRYYGAGDADNTPCLDTFGTAYAAVDVQWIWRVPGATERILKQALLIQPLTVAHYINSSFSSYAYATNNTCWYGSGTEDSSHAVELIGYDDNDTCDLDGGVGTWIIKNQYGSGWGQDGYAKVSRSGHTDLTTRQASGSTNASMVISVVDSVPYWSVPGILGGSEVLGLAATTPTDIAANGWQAIEIPAWVIRAMKNGKISRSIVLVAETSTTSSGVQFATTENATSADRPYLVLKSIPESQFQLKIGNAKIGNAGIGR